MFFILIVIHLSVSNRRKKFVIIVINSPVKKFQPLARYNSTLDLLINFYIGCSILHFCKQVYS